MFSSASLSSGAGASTTLATGKKSPHSMILLCGQHQTFLCHAGDLQPIPVVIPPITASLLSVFFARFVNTSSTTPMAATSMPTLFEKKQPPSSPSRFTENISPTHVSSTFSSPSPSSIRSSVESPLASLTSLAQQLHCFLSGQHVVVIVPVSFSSLRSSSSGATGCTTILTPPSRDRLDGNEAGMGTDRCLPARSTATTRAPWTTPSASSSSSPTHFLDHLAVFLQHPLVGVSSLLVVSDMVATAIAGGCTNDVLILHVGQWCCTIGYVVDGCTKRFGTCQWNALHLDGRAHKDAPEEVEEEEDEKEKPLTTTTTTTTTHQRVPCSENTVVRRPHCSTALLEKPPLEERSESRQSTSTSVTTMGTPPKRTPPQDVPSFSSPSSSFSSPTTAGWRNTFASFFGCHAVERVFGKAESTERHATVAPSTFSSTSLSSSHATPFLHATTSSVTPSHTATAGAGRLTPDRTRAESEIGKILLLLARVYQPHLSHHVIITGDALGSKGSIWMRLLHAMLQETPPAAMAHLLQATPPSTFPTPPSDTPSSRSTGSTSPRRVEENDTEHETNPSCRHRRDPPKRARSSDSCSLHALETTSTTLPPHPLGKEAKKDLVAVAAPASLSSTTFSLLQAQRSHNNTERDEEEDEDEDEEDEEEEEESSQSTSTEDSSSASAASWCMLPTCPPHAPWWMPLIGGSILAQFAERDVRAMRILPSEIVETNGKIVYWKGLL